MLDQQRDRVGPRTAPLDEVNLDRLAVRTIQRRSVLRERVQQALCGAPVEAVGPVVAELTQERAINPVEPLEPGTSRSQRVARSRSRSSSILASATATWNGVDSTVDLELAQRAEKVWMS